MCIWSECCIFVLESLSQVRTPKNNILIKAEKVYSDQISYKSLKLYVDPLYDPTNHSTTFGEVVGVPDGMSQSHHIHKFIIPEVKVGDRVYFHYNAMIVASEEKYKLKDNDGNDVYSIPYEFIFCSVRSEKIIMIGGRVLCETIECGEDIGLGVGTIKGKVSKGGIVTEINTSHNLNKATIAHIGTPMKNEPDLGVKAGDVIWYEKNADMEYKIEGKSYLCMRQEDLMILEADGQSTTG